MAAALKLFRFSSQKAVHTVSSEGLKKLEGCIGNDKSMNSPRLTGGCNKMGSLQQIFWCWYTTVQKAKLI